MKRTLDADSSIDSETVDSIGYLGEALAVSLNNEKQDIENALYVIQHLIGLFSSSPDLSGKLREDEKTLKKLKRQKDEADAIIEQLKDIENLAKAIRETLSADLEKKASELLSKMEAVDQQLRKRPADETTNGIREHLAGIIRSLAVDLHNKRQETRIALRISKAIAYEFSDLSSIKERLIQDAQTLQREVEAKERKTTAAVWRTVVFVAIVVVICISIYSNSSSSIPAANTSTDSSTRSVATSSPATPKPTVKLTPYPVYNGKIIIRPEYEQVCPLEIKAGSGDDYYIYLKYLRGPASTTVSREKKSTATAPYESNMAFYVKAGQTVEVHVPIGVYKLYYSTGDTFYGTKDLFGDTTRCYSSSETLEFYADRSYYQGCSLTLYKVTNGNFSTDSISESDFPKG